MMNLDDQSGLDDPDQNYVIERNDNFDDSGESDHENKRVSKKSQWMISDEWEFDQ